MKNVKAEYGIWGGRFQIIHRGHEFVLSYVNNNYNNVCIGIVDPIPDNPPCDVLEHEKFDPQKNPFTYFQRAYLWNLLLRHNSIEAVIVPHWHPRKSLKLESTFLPLPPHTRHWVIPFLPGEDFKIKDLEKAGEIVDVLDEEENDNLKLIHSSRIKKLFDDKVKDFKDDIPEKIQFQTEDFLNRKKLEENFIIIPILGDNLHPLLICGGIQLSFDNNQKLIYAPVVNVVNEKKWWNFESIEDGNFTFYEKHEIINVIMKKLQFYDYMVAPIIVKNNKCQAIDSFLPKPDSRTWFFTKENSNPIIFKEFRRESSLKINCQELVFKDIYKVVSCFKDRLYEQLGYNNIYFNNIESEEDKRMAKNDFTGMQVTGNVFITDIIEGEIRSDVYNGAEKENYAEGMIFDVLKANDEIGFKNHLKKADDFFKTFSETEIQRIVDETVNKYIDTNERKNTLFQNLKRFSLTVSNSIVSGLILQALKNKLF